MPYKTAFLLLFPAFLFSCQTTKHPTATTNPQIRPDTFTLHDTIRDRDIPIALFTTGAARQKIVVFSHGYGGNRGGDYLAYSYLTEQLAREGWFVVSIQHELPTDALLPLTGIPQVVRRPFWERGSDNIQFVINYLKTAHLGLDFRHITLIGHSNGGDMCALFPVKYPGVAHKIITLDNRRMPLPKTKLLKVYSLRSSDQPADEDVLPTPEEQKKYGTTIAYLPNTPHNNMDDNGNNVQHKEIVDWVLKFLRE